MDRPQVDVQIFPAHRSQVSSLLVRRAVREVLGHHQTDTECQVGVVVADDATVRSLNKEYRGLDEVTDVLAFAFNYPGKYYGEPSAVQSTPNWPSMAPLGAPEPIGEVVISFPQAARQAEESGHSVHQELTHLTVHGVLHLLGYDHLEPDDERLMRGRERDILSRLVGGE